MSFKQQTAHKTAKLQQKLNRYPLIYCCSISPPKKNISAGTAFAALPSSM
jgi:hypothetical protein